MKKLFLIPLFLMLGFSLSAQTGFKAGIHLGFPVGDGSDYSDFNLGLDVSYLWPITPAFSAGISSGYSHFISKDVKIHTPWGTIKHEIDDFGYVPIAATAQYIITPGFFGSIDLGYAIATGSDWDGGFYWQPKLGYDTQFYQIYGFYKGISDNENISSVGIGAAYKF